MEKWDTCENAYFDTCFQQQPYTAATEDKRGNKEKVFVRNQRRITARSDFQYACLKYTARRKVTRL